MPDPSKSSSDPEAERLKTSATMLLRLRPESPARELAWEAFHEMYAPVIAGFARQLRVRGEEADGLVQDVLVGFFRQSDRFVYDPAKGKFRAFLRLCTFRMLVKTRGKTAKFQGQPIESIDPAGPELEETWEKVWADEQLRQALARVKRRYAVNEERARTFKAFELYVLRERPQDEVARELNLSIASVHQAKHRVTAALRRELQKLETTHG